MKLCRIYMHPTDPSPLPRPLPLPLLLPLPWPCQLAFLGCGVAENHRTIKIIIKGHAAAAACYAKCPNGIVSHGGWLPREAMGDG